MPVLQCPPELAGLPLPLLAGTDVVVIRVFVKEPPSPDLDARIKRFGSDDSDKRSAMALALQAN